MSLKNAIEEAFQLKLAFYQLAHDTQDEDFLSGKIPIPKNRRTYQAFLKWVNACNKISPKVQLGIALDNNKKDLVTTILKSFMNLRDALEKGDLNLLTIFLDNGTSVDTVIESTPLVIHAVRFKQLSLMNALIQRGATLDFEFFYELIISNHREIFSQELQKTGFTLTERSLNAFFDIALRKGHIDLCKDLLEMSCPIDKNNLLIVINRCQAELLEFMLNSLHGSCEASFAKKQETLLNLNLDLNNIPFSMIPLLINYVACPATALINATKDGIERAPLLKILLDRGFEVDLKDEQGKTALHHAAAKGSAESVLVLLTHGAAIEERDLLGYTPLHRAVISNKENTVRTLLNYGANIDSLTTNGETGLHLAVSQRNNRMILLLVSQKANLEALDKNGDTPLLLSIKNESLSFARYRVSIFLNAGASPFAENQSGQSFKSLEPEAFAECIQWPEKNKQSLIPLNDFINYLRKKTSNPQLQKLFLQLQNNMNEEGQKFYKIDLKTWLNQVEEILKAYKPSEKNLLSWFFAEEPDFMSEFEILKNTLTAESTQQRRYILG